MFGNENNLINIHESEKEIIMELMKYLELSDHKLSLKIVGCQPDLKFAITGK